MFNFIFQLSASSLAALHQLIQYVQSGDYQTSLALHTQMISGPDFSQMSSFMPSVKVLLQTSYQLGVYVQ
jgi:protein transport protein SEC31